MTKQFEPTDIRGCHWFKIPDGLVLDDNGKVVAWKDTLSDMTLYANKPLEVKDYEIILKQED